VVATVNGRPIDQNSFDGQVSLRLYAGPFGDANTPKDPINPPLELKLEVLDQMVSLETAYQEALANGYAPKPEEVEKILERVAGEYGGGVKELEGTLTEFGDSLDRLKNQISYNETIKNWRDTAFLSKAIVSDAEAKAFYEERSAEAEHPDQIQALQIIFPVPMSMSGDQAKARETIRLQAEEALKEAKAGVNFEDLAKKYMTPNTRSISNDGKMGWVAQDGVFPELEEALFKLVPGQISEIVDTPFSLHILKALAFRPAGKFTYEEVRPSILEFLTNQRIDEAVAEKIEELRAKTKVVVLEPDLAKAWPEYLQKRAGESVESTAPAAPNATNAKTEPAAPSATDAKTEPAPNATDAKTR
jgi:parvulin-like peptidyl-prolyl isomerase